MSHSLIITVVSIREVANGSESFGFLASDGEGSQLWEDGWPSLAAFTMQFDSEDALVEYVKSQRDEWCDWQGHVQVQGYV